MRRLLVVSPHYPPSDVVEMHRVRMNVRYYRQHGWDPMVLCVTPETAGRMVNPDLMATVPDDVPVVRVRAFPETVSALVGVHALGIRAFGALDRAGRRIFGSWRPDLVFISTTAFPAMGLGPVWKRRFGAPYVLDLQDPWYTAPPTSAPFSRRGVKRRLIDMLHRRAERAAMEDAGGLVVVSSDYGPPLLKAYPSLAAKPLATIPFGYAQRDFEAAAALARPPALLDEIAGPVGVSAGRYGADMRRQLDALLAMLAGLDSWPERPRLLFVGTGYLKAGNRPVVAPIATEGGFGGDILEAPDRLPLLDALKLQQKADFLVLLGSEDLSYQPSKLFLYLATDRPILCVTPSDGRCASILRDLKSVFIVYSDRAVDDAVRAGFRAWWERSRAPGLSDPRRAEIAGRYSAETLAGEECALFDRVFEQRAEALREEP